MFSFLVKRLLQSIVVLIAVALIAFSLFKFVGDPINNMVGQDTTLDEREALRERLGLNDPFPIQFYHFISKAAVGDFGISYRHKIPVSALIAERAPATLELSIISALLAVFIGIPMGVYTAIHRSGFISRSFMTLSLVGISLPTFLIGILFIFLF
ncbi:MAG: ABC transporter permease, partial [Pseudomonadales bacterium]|nr:ABC transporter permease [Pseudomonadales bacterium]